jgi:hypothetical protein
MIAAFFAKFGLPAFVLLFGVTIGIGVQQKVLGHKPTAPPEIDYARIQKMITNIPQPTVSVQPFAVDKFKNLKTFTYSPAFTGSISVAGVDSASIRRYIEEAVTKAIEKQLPLETKRRRR